MLCVDSFRCRRRTTGRRRREPRKNFSVPSQIRPSSSWPTGWRCVLKVLSTSRITKNETFRRCSVNLVYDFQIRGTLKSWTKLWCVLKPGVLLIYKTNKNGQWVGTVLLNACELIERPSKKDGFCFKLFHPLEQSIWAVKVPERTPSSVILALCLNRLMRFVCVCVWFRVLKEKRWAPSLSRYPAVIWSSERPRSLTVRHKHTRVRRSVCVCITTETSTSVNSVCRSLLDGRSWIGPEMFEFVKENHDQRGQRRDGTDRRTLAHQLLQSAAGAQHTGLSVRTHTQTRVKYIQRWSLKSQHVLWFIRFNDSDQFKDPDLYSDKSDRENEQEQEEWENEVMEKSEESDSDTSERQEDSYVDLDETLRETPYMEQTDEELGEVCVCDTTKNKNTYTLTLFTCLLSLCVDKCFIYFICKSLILS